MNAKTFILLFAAGGLGALSRFGLSSLVNYLTNYQFPLGTLVVNALGCFLFGFFWSLAEHYGIGSQTRLIILTGFLGAFTTFSSMIFESTALTGYRLLPAALNIAAHLAAGFLSFYGGIKFSRLFFSSI